MILRPCIEPGCPGLGIFGPRCREHERIYQAKRNARPERSYLRTGAYRKNLNPKGMVCAIQSDVCTYWATTVDHIIPPSQGGTDDPENLRPACRECNSSRAGRMRT